MNRAQVFVFWLLSIFVPMAAANAQEFLPPEKAFQVNATARDPDCKTNCYIDVSIDIEDEYYLYRERFKLQPESGVAQVDWVNLPNGERKFDENLGMEIEALRGLLEFEIKYTLTQDAENAVLNLISQGCADAGLCYPPMTNRVELQKTTAIGKVLGGLGMRDIFSQKRESLSGQASGSIDLAVGATGSVSETTESGHVVSDPVLSRSGGVGVSVPTQPQGNLTRALDESGGLAKRLDSQPIYVVLPVFFGLGLLLAFTPCTLPMLPIVTSLVVGQAEGEGEKSKVRSFSLAFVYVLGMALTYALLGVMAGLSGQSLVVALQQPLVLWSFGGLLGILGVALLLGYQIQLPSSFQGWLQQKTGRLQGGQFVPVLVMGILSALLLGPCVAPPLAGALLYIGQTGDAVVGGFALFLLALGMGLPMVLLAAGAGALIPRAGNWMKVVSGAFGFVLLAVALWVIQPVTSSSLMFMFWIVWLILVAASLRVVIQSGWIKSVMTQTLMQAAGVLAQLLALVYLIGWFTGSDNLLKPFEQLASRSSNSAVVSHKSSFEHVPSKDIKALIAESKIPVMLDFYADWCVSCKEFELLTLPDQRVQELLNGIRLVQVDVTRNDADDQALMKTFGLFGPPAILFFQKGGFEVSAHRVVGFQSADKFSGTLTAVREAIGLPL